MLTKQDKQYLEEKYYDKSYLDEQFRGIAWEFERVHERLDRLEKKMDQRFNELIAIVQDFVEKSRQHDEQLSDHEKRIRGIENKSLN